MRRVLRGRYWFILLLGTLIQGAPRLRVVTTDGNTTTELRPGVPAIIDVIVPDERMADAEVTIDGLPQSAIRAMSTSTSTSSMNGVTRTEVRYRYTVVFDAAGSYTIGPAHVKTSSGDLQESNSVNIIVREESPEEKSKSPSALHVRLAADRTDVVQGELVPLTLRAQVPQNYTVRGLRPEVPPSVHVYGHLEPNVTRNTGHSELVTRVSIAPRVAGTITMPAWSLEVEDRGARHNPFTFFGFFSGQTAQAYSNSVTLRVAPLPAGCAFAGLLHDATLSVEKNSCSAGEAISASLVLDVTADRHGVTAVPLTVPDGLRVYVASVTPEGEGMRGIVRMRYTIHAIKPGTYTLTNNTMQYFDTAVRAVRTVDLSHVSLTVTPAPIGETSQKVETVKEELPAEEATEQESAHQFNPYRVRMPWSWWFLLVFLITFLCLAHPLWVAFVTSNIGKKVVHKFLVLRTRRALRRACAQRDGAAAHRIAIEFFERTQTRVRDNAWMASLERCAFDRTVEPREYDAIAAEVHRWIV